MKILSLRTKQIVTSLGLSLAAVAPAFADGVDNTAILASITDAQTKGVAVAGGVTLMIFAFAAAKWLRRAK